MPLKDYPMACLTNWGSVLSVSNVGKEAFPGLISIHDPDCIDPGGQVIGDSEIKLLWRVKSPKQNINK